MQTNSTISQIEKLLPRLREFGVRSIGVFGSAARNELTEDSDVDILIEFTDQEANGFFQVLFLLEDTLQRHVDLAMPDTLHPRLKEKVLAEVRRVA
jgi:uncharacterized protein